MKTLKEFIYEGCCSRKQSAMRKKCSGKRCKRIKESADITFDMTYPDADFGMEYVDAIDGKNKVRSAKTALELFRAIGNQLTDNDGDAYHISLEVDGVELVACMPEKQLWASDPIKATEVVRLLKQNRDDIVDAIIEWYYDEAGWNDINGDQDRETLLKLF